MTKLSPLKLTLSLYKFRTKYVVFLLFFWVLTPFVERVVLLVKQAKKRQKIFWNVSSFLKQHSTNSSSHLRVSAQPLSTITARWLFQIFFALTLLPGPSLPGNSDNTVLHIPRHKRSNSQWQARQQRTTSTTTYFCIIYFSVFHSRHLAHLPEFERKGNSYIMLKSRGVITFR